MGAKKKLSWEDFEAEVAEQVRAHIDSYRTLLRPGAAKVYRQRAYYSKDRENDILFDVVVEAFDPGTTEPTLRWIWECKDYPNRLVPVGDIEEFTAKLDQIGPMNVRGTVVTRNGFQEAAYSYAKSQRISLYVLQKDLVRVTQYDHRVRTIERKVFACLEALFPNGNRYGADDGWTLDMAIQVELRDMGLLTG